MPVDMIQNKKFIALGGWLFMLYPAAQNDFEDSEDSFLFYNPDCWTGNFRISAFRGEKDKKSGLTYGAATLRQVLKDNASTKQITIKHFPAVYGKEMFMENEEYFTTHWWVIDANDIVIDCSFTVHKGADIQEAESVINSIELRDENEKYPAELIAIRLSEIFVINESYDWTVKLIKEKLKQDFQGDEAALSKLQQIIDNGLIAPKKRE